MTVNVAFLPSSKTIPVKEGVTVLAAARKAGVYIDSQCNGKGKCGKCRVRVVEGGVSPFSEREKEFINDSERQLGYRLACLTRIEGEAKILVTGEDVIISAAGEKIFSRRAAHVNPAVKSYILGMPYDCAGTRLYQYVCNCLQEQHGLEGLMVNHPLRHVTGVKKGQNIRVLVWMGREIIDVRLEEGTKLLGLAVDIGTTTVALYICDLNDGSVVLSGSFTNPQVLFGTDIMSRISYSAEHPREGVTRMRAELLRAINVFIREAAVKEGFSMEQIVDATVVGNTVIHHIFLGIPPDRLGLWPFEPAVTASTTIKVSESGLEIHPEGFVHVLPVEAGFVGADNVAVLISEEPHKKDLLSLIIDLGTNGELVLGNKERLMSCSCATGPAFEGAQISSGIRATAGAIEKIRISPDTYAVDYAVVGTKGWASEYAPGTLKPIGICGSAILDALASLFNTGIIQKNGAFTKNRIPGLRKNDSGIMEFLFVSAPETGIGRDIVLTQKDVRQIQLAKAAVQAGCRVLMRHFGLDSIDGIIIAGAFGLHIDKRHALDIGLLPGCDPEKVQVVGNAAGHGAYLALIDTDKRVEADAVARKVEHIELALEDDFQQEFLRCLSIPYV